MNAIFDENSEFLNYLKQNQNNKNNSDNSSSSFENRQSPDQTPLTSSNYHNSTFKIGGIDIKSELGDDLFNELAEKLNLNPKTSTANTDPVNSSSESNFPTKSSESTQLNQPNSHFVLNLKDKQLKDKSLDPNTQIPVKKISSTKLEPNLQLANSLPIDYQVPKNDNNINPNHIPSQDFINLNNQKEVKKLQKLNKLPINNSLSAFIIDKLKFLFISGIIFVVTFMAINWSAYSKIFENWYLNISGSEYSSPLLNFQNGAVALLPTGLDFVEYTDVPKLNIEVTPPGMRIIIPRLRSNVPVIGVSDSTLISNDWDALESEIQEALRDGVVHYPGTPYPNQSGNVVLTGHSSYYPWDPGRFKDVFAVLHQATIGDEIIVFYDQKKYLYQIVDIKKVLPSEVNVLGDSGDDRLTLITCTPIGTNLQRLIVTAKPIK